MQVVAHRRRRARGGAHGAASSQPDVVLMDLSMPELNGADATRAILERDPKCRVIVLSMYAEREYVRRALKAGAAGYVVEALGGEGSGRRDPRGARRPALPQPAGRRRRDRGLRRRRARPTCSSACRRASARCCSSSPRAAPAREIAAAPFALAEDRRNLPRAPGGEARHPRRRRPGQVRHPARPRFAGLSSWAFCASPACAVAGSRLTATVGDTRFIEPSTAHDARVADNAAG